MADIVGIRYKPAGRIYYFDPGDFELSVGEAHTNAHETSENDKHTKSNNVSSMNAFCVPITIVTRFS